MDNAITDWEAGMTAPADGNAGAAGNVSDTSVEGLTPEGVSSD
ncbi:MAG: hypothetical protein ACLP4V_26135 [Methylocella sp.]